ncbi:hypothetical protein CBR_g913 [Chara braunii]|uniref:RRM domain-containing protein n=1 Tax=Chara braunii TaxID=69332 RepID=A0A388KCK2_CHABU|nr:hypothetical protein CBR_g913 [Chara braunii]|eukprot:GBG67788.1 hypothetical protein CBR_g913 [Chara braunii]
MAGEGGLEDYDAEEGREELVDFECSDFEFDNEEEDAEIGTGEEEVMTGKAGSSSDKGGGAGTQEAAVSASTTVAVAATPAAIAVPDDEEEGGEKGVVGDLSGLSPHRRVRPPPEDDDDDSRPSSPGWRRARGSSRARDGDDDDDDDADKDEGIGVYVAAGGSVTCPKGDEVTTAAPDSQQNGDSALDVPIAEQSASAEGDRRRAHDDVVNVVVIKVNDDDDRGAHHAVGSTSPGSSGSSGLAWEKHSSEEEDDDVANTMQLESLGGPREEASLAEASNVDGQEGKPVDEAQITEGTEETNVKGVEREDGGATNEDKLVEYNKRGNDGNANNIDDGDDDDEDEDDEESGRRGRKRRKERFAAERKIEAEDLEREDQYSLAARMKRLKGTKWDGSLEAANLALAAGAAGMMVNPGELHGRGAMGRGIMGPGRPPAPLGAIGRGGPLQGFMPVPGPGGHPLRPFDPGFASAQFEMQELMAQQRLMGGGPKPADLAALQAGRGGGRGLGGPGPPFVGMPSALGPVPGGPRPGGFEMYAAGPGMPPRGVPGAFSRPGLVAEQMLGMGPGSFAFLGPGAGPFPMCMSPRGIGMRPGAPFPGMLDGPWMGGMATGGPPGKGGPAMPVGMGWEENVAGGAGSSPTNPPKGSNRTFPEGTNIGNAAMMGVLDPSLQNRTDMQRRADIERHGGGVAQRRNEVGRIENRRGPEMHDMARGELGRVVEMGRMDVGNRFDMARAGIGRGTFEMRNDVGRGDVGRSDYGRVDLRKGELMRGDIGRVAEPPRGDYVGRGELQRLGMGVSDAGRVDMGRLDMRMMDVERAELARMQSGRGGEYGRSEMMRMAEMGSVGGERKGGGGGSSRAPTRQERGSENGKGGHDGGRNRHLATGSNLIQLGGPVTKSRTLVVSNIGKDLKGSSIAKTFATSGDVTSVNRLPNGNLLVSYSSVAEAVAAKRHFHRSVLGGSEITVEYAVGNPV